MATGITNDPFDGGALRFRRTPLMDDLADVRHPSGRSAHALRQIVCNSVIKSCWIMHASQVPPAAPRSIWRAVQEFQQGE